MSLMGILDRVADLDTFDKVIEPARRAVLSALKPPALKDALHGTWLGHPLHPVLVQVPVGSWVSAGLLDAIPPLRPAATLLIGTGVAAAVPAALSGAADWSEQSAGVRRLGALHAVLNTAALGLYAGSLVARRNGRGGVGRVLELHRPRDRERLGVDRRPHVVRAVLRGLALGDGRPRAHHRVDRPRAARRPARGSAGAADRQGEQRRRSPGRRPPGWAGRRVRRCLFAPLRAAVRGHRGEARGEECLVCPWHGSAFDLDEGQPRRGPAANPQEKLEVRMEAGRVLARVPARNR